MQRHWQHEIGEWRCERLSLARQQHGEQAPRRELALELERAHAVIDREGVTEGRHDDAPRLRCPGHARRPGEVAFTRFAQIEGDAPQGRTPHLQDATLGAAEETGGWQAEAQHRLRRSLDRRLQKRHTVDRRVRDRDHGKSLAAGGAPVMPQKHVICVEMR
ncbi:MAG: hypothetical protein CMLOHMNK_00766 [Steroidobacteraceae bacterium]|nr:hypothetical protein [Steroidobacteraceae bacterium]